MWRQRPGWRAPRTHRQWRRQRYPVSPSGIGTSSARARTMELTSSGMVVAAEGAARRGAGLLDPSAACSAYLLPPPPLLTRGGGGGPT